MTILTNELIRDLDLTYVPYGSYAKKPIDNRWLFVEHELLDYSECVEEHRIVWQNIETGKYYAFNYSSSSWDGYEFDEPYEPYEVVPTQKTITVYEAV